MYYRGQIRWEKITSQSNESIKIKNNWLQSVSLKGGLTALTFFILLTGTAFLLGACASGNTKTASQKAVSQKAVQPNKSQTVQQKTVSDRKKILAKTQCLDKALVKCWKHKNNGIYYQCIDQYVDECMRAKGFKAAQN